MRKVRFRDAGSTSTILALAESLVPRRPARSGGVAFHVRERVAGRLPSMAGLHGFGSNGVDHLCGRPTPRCPDEAFG